MLEGIQRTVGKEQLQVVGVNVEEREKFKRVARAIGSTLTLTLTHDSGKQASDAYGVHGIPHFVLIGRDGKILKVHRGYSEESLDGIIAEVNAALAAGPAAKETRTQGI